jgi:hypothetical protein
MRISQRSCLWLTLAVIAVALVWSSISLQHHKETPAAKAITDLSVTSPLNQPGGGMPPAEAYEIYSSLYQAPMQEPLAFAEDSVADIPQVNGSCLKPSTPQEREMTDAFVIANRQSHRWEKKLTAPNGYRLPPGREAAEALACLDTHGQDVAGCESYKQLRHVRFLGVPGFDHEHTRALVSVVRKCGGFCGSGGIFEVEKTRGRWQRSETTDFTRDCSWVYER